eukprot:4300185-Pyramimonas_sp.AAC.1
MAERCQRPFASAHRPRPRLGPGAPRYPGRPRLVKAFGGPRAPDWRRRRPALRGPPPSILIP